MFPRPPKIYDYDSMVYISDKLSISYDIYSL